MRGLKTVLATGALGAVVAIGALAVTTTSASAYVACNRHDCWHVATKPVYPVSFGIQFYPDTWRGYRGRGYHYWGNHPGRGYYDHGRWRRW
jgi:hypothetical protein